VTAAGRRHDCPAWCTRDHDALDGEEAWLHVGRPQTPDGEAGPLLAMTREPGTGVVDGPWVLVGDDEYSLEQAKALGTALIGTAAIGEVSLGGAGRRSPGP
jgi:hypothetical protein